MEQGIGTEDFWEAGTEGGGTGSRRCLKKCVLSRKRGEGFGHVLGHRRLRVFVTLGGLPTNDSRLKWVGGGYAAR